MNRAINTRRLTKKQVQELLKVEGGKLHEEYSRKSGNDGRDLVYKLPGDRFLYVFDPDGITIPGKGDIYSGEYFRNLIDWTQRVEADFAHGRGSSVQHWRYYSQYKSELLNHMDALLANLASELVIETHLLDKSYASLDLISHKLEQYGKEKAYANLYDNLVAYVGEVIKLRVKGTWVMNTSHAGGSYPFVDVLGVQYMPINAVWSAICGIDKINLRSETTKIVRENGWRLNLAKGTSE